MPERSLCLAIWFSVLTTLLLTAQFWLEFPVSIFHLSRLRQRTRKKSGGQKNNDSSFWFSWQRLWINNDAVWRDHLAWQKPSFNAQCRDEDDEADKKSWHHIREVTGLPFAESQSEAHDHYWWQVIVRKSSVVPRQPPHLEWQGWWWWGWWGWWQWILTHCFCLRSVKYQLIKVYFYISDIVIILMEKSLSIYLILIWFFF